MELLITLGIVAGTLGLAILVTYLKKAKNVKVDPQILAEIAQAFELTTDIVDELDLQNEKQIQEIVQIVKDAIDYTVKLSISNAEIDADEEAFDFASSVLSAAGIELTAQRERIVRALISYGLDLVM